MLRLPQISSTITQCLWRVVRSVITFYESNSSMIRILAIIILLATASTAAANTTTWRPGLLPGVWWGTAPAGPPIMVQPMQRYRVWVPWWRRMPPVIYYPVQPQQPTQPTWGAFQGQWGFGTPPIQPNQ